MEVILCNVAQFPRFAKSYFLQASVPVYEVETNNAESLQFFRTQTSPADHSPCNMFPFCSGSIFPYGNWHLRSFIICCRHPCDFDYILLFSSKTYIRITFCCLLDGFRSQFISLSTRGESMFASVFVGIRHVLRLRRFLFYNDNFVVRIRLDDQTLFISGSYFMF